MGVDDFDDDSDRMVRDARPQELLVAVRHLRSLSPEEWVRPVTVDDVLSGELQRRTMDLIRAAADLGQMWDLSAIPSSLSYKAALLTVIALGRRPDDPVIAEIQEVLRAE